MVTFPEIERILEILDEREISRERIEIPLGAKDPGGVKTLSNGKIRVTVPASGDFEPWLERIQPEILLALGWTEG
jgi:hypothetical protein